MSAIRPASPRDPQNFEKNAEVKSDGKLYVNNIQREVTWDGDAIKDPNRLTHIAKTINAAPQKHNSNADSFSVTAGKHTFTITKSATQSKTSSVARSLYKRPLPEIPNQTVQQKPLAKAPLLNRKELLQKKAELEKNPVYQLAKGIQDLNKSGHSFDFSDSEKAILKEMDDLNAQLKRTIVRPTKPPPLPPK